VATLATLAPENVAHGADILVQGLGPVGGYVTLAEIYELDFDVDNDKQELPSLGTRRTAYRWGRLKVTGTVKAYWLNAAVHSEWMGAVTPNTGGSSSQIYASAIPFQRYNIRVNLSATANPSVVPIPHTFINVVFEKDTSKWEQAKFTVEDLAFVAEDVLYA